MPVLNQHQAAVTGQLSLISTTFPANERNDQKSCGEHQVELFLYGQRPAMKEWLRIGREDKIVALHHEFNVCNRQRGCAERCAGRSKILIGVNDTRSHNRGCSYRGERR